MKRYLEQGLSSIDKVMTVNPTGGEAVQYCGSGRYCCGTESACCRGDQLDILILGEPNIYATAGVYSVSSSSAILAQTPSSTVTSMANFAPSSSLSIAKSEASGTDLDTKSHTEGDGRQVLAVGLGVGLSLGFVIVALVMAGLWWIRKIQRVVVTGTVEELHAQEPHGVELEVPGKSMSATELYDKSTYQYRIEMPTLESR